MLRKFGGPVVSTTTYICSRVDNEVAWFHHRTIVAMVIFFLIIGDLYFCCHRSWCPGIKMNFEEFFVKRRRSARKRLESLGWTFKDSLRISTKNFIKQCCSQPTQYAATSPRIPWLLVLESPNLSFPPSGSQ